MTICLAVIAKNEERSLPVSLRCLLESVNTAETALPVRFDVVVVADDCTDNTARIACSYSRIRVLTSTGGKVEAQRRVANTAPFVIYSDADVLVTKNTVSAVCRPMLENTRLQIVYPRKRPLPPVRSTFLAQALHCYNRVNGFQKPRRYFNGKFFAIRDWNVPTRAELASRLSSLPEDRFYNFHAGMRIDDIWLSRDILSRYGDCAIAEVEDGDIWYRPPETFQGMYRTYHRMRLEIERLNRMFPESVRVHQHRGYDREAVRSASWKDRWLWRYFRIALGVCRLRYRCEKFYYQSLSSTACSAWKPIQETKESLDTVLPA